MGLLDRLSRIVPKGLDTHVFANSGSEVVENAIKMARAHTKKTNIIAFDVSSCQKAARYCSCKAGFAVSHMIACNVLSHTRLPVQSW